ncbi:hypothetical protein ACQPW3_39985 [Actinosynnema sp. CA-248983]
MPEPDPFASPFHHVRLPGEPEPTTGYGFPGPMPGAPEASTDPHAGNPYAAPSYGLPTMYPYVSASSVHITALERPAALLVASWSWLVATILVVVVLPGLVFAFPDVLANGLYEKSLSEIEPMTRAESEIVARITVMFFVLIFAVLAVPYVVAAIKLRGGRNWPRVLLAVLGALGAMFGLGMLAAFATGSIPYVNWLVGTVWALLFLGAVFLGIVAMFVPPANAYVRAVSAR